MIIRKLNVKYKQIYFLLILSALTLSGYCQDVWTLERCILYALENNITIKQQELDVEFSKNNFLQSKAEVLPDLSANASQNYRFGRSVDPLTYEFTNENTSGSSFSASSGINLFNGLQTINNISKNKLNLNKSMEDLQRARNDLSLNIARAYLQILFNKELLVIAQNQLEITGQQVEQTRKLVNAGSLPRGDLLEIQAQYSTEELQVVNTENQLDLAYLNLAQLLDLESPDNFTIATPEFGDITEEEIVFSVPTIYKQAVVSLPRVKSAEFQLEAVKKDLLIARGLLSPSISLGGSLSTGFSDNIKSFGTNSTMPFREQIDFAQNKSLGFRLSIPIFNRFSTRINISNSKINVLQNEYNLKFIKNQLLKEIQQAYADAKAAMKNFRASQKTVESLSEAFGYAQQKYTLGMLNTVDYNLAKNKLTKAQSDLLQAKYSYIFNNKILDFYRGNPINL